MKKLLFIVFIAATLVACNKNQSAVRKLDGTWTLIQLKSGGITIDASQMEEKVEMTFDNCKLKNDEWCNLTLTFTEGNQSESEKILYRVTGDGEVLETKDDANSTSIDKMTVVELKKKSLTLKVGEGSNTYEYLLEKN
jgi:hypothetical protein